MTLAQQLEALTEKLRFRYHLLFHHQTSPFGPEYQKYWDHRFAFFSKFDQGIQTDVEGLHSVTPEKTARGTAKLLKTKTVVDAFCGIGGNTIAFAQVCDKVFTFDTNQDRLNMAKHNAAIYQRSNIIFINDDFRNHLSNIPKETIFLDPPWGGLDWKHKNPFTLNDLTPNGYELLNAALTNFRYVILRMPDNFDVQELKKFDYAYKIIPNILEGRLISQTIFFDAQT